MILHPCPHCGKTETDRDESTGMNAVEACSYPSSNVACVQCHYCGLSGPLEETVALAITAWNSLPRKAATPHKLAPGQTWEGAFRNGPRRQRRIIAADDTGVLWHPKADKARLYHTGREDFVKWAERLLP